ncbi:MULTISPECIES: hypothetical protein [Amniculibacterium]|uniref:hypothetical protein n=1 Tax=Amniculibacterium TaxID=2715289 RepID=UPI000F5A37E3|nr:MULTISPECIES: hypothetical protein [Amniculibacterium]
MYKISTLVLCFIIFVSCTTRPNQYIKVGKNEQQRHGFWVENSSADIGDLIEKGKYKKGVRVGTWKSTHENTLYQKERYRKNITKTKTYYPNGNMKEKGQSRMDVNEIGSHWYYYGDWKYYNENGKLLYIKKYNQGKKIDSISLIKSKV